MNGRVWRHLCYLIAGDGDLRRRRRPAMATANLKTMTSPHWVKRGKALTPRRRSDEEEALDEDPGARPRIRQLGEAEGRGGKRALNKFYWNSSWCSTGWQSIGQSDSAARNKFEMQVFTRYIPGIDLSDSEYMYLVHTRYIPGICFGVYVGIYQVYTRYIPGLEITRYIPHLESCTPGQDWAKWYVLVRTSTYQYKTVQASTRIPSLYILVCTSTYLYVPLRTWSQVVFWPTQKASGETSGTLGHYDITYDIT